MAKSWSNRQWHDALNAQLEYARLHGEVMRPSDPLTPGMLADMCKPMPPEATPERIRELIQYCDDTINRLRG